MDASAFMLGENKKLPQDEFFVFYNNKLSPDGAVEAGDDDLTGGNSDGGDDETLMVDLTKVSPKINEIVFTVTIHEWDKRKQNFGQVRNCLLSILSTAHHSRNSSSGYPPQLRLAIRASEQPMNWNSRHHQKK